MKKVLTIVLILLGILLVLGIAAFLYIKSMLPNGGGNNDIVEGYYSWKQPLDRFVVQCGVGRIY